tara:strand:+ start:325 stop:537 length:213 start_codon:yes stop_codon:yes gene_type:complete
MIQSKPSVINFEKRILPPKNYLQRFVRYHWSLHKLPLINKSLLSLVWGIRYKIEIIDQLNPNKINYGQFH